MRYRVARYRGGYAVVWYDEGGKRHRRALGADKWQAHAVAGQVVEAVTAPRGPMSVGQIVEAYLDKTEAIGKETMRSHWQAAKPVFGPLAPQMVSEAVCREYAATRGAKVKPATIRKELGIVRAALKRAKVDTPFWMPSEPPPRDRRLDRAEMAKLESACTQPHLLLFVLMARYTAARAGAILGLRWTQVDLEQRQIHLGGSGRQKRRARLPIHPNLAWALACAQRAAISPFVIEYAGRRVASIKRGFRAAARRAGVADVTPHVLRHTAATWMAESGVPIEEIAQYLGHTSPAVTFRVYARYTPGHLRNAMKALG